ncbi:MAG TPA: class I SAM-dependent methyltransferase [Solirubrobacteraceae bacterium]|nr:class I SAM-dependent methyltransferase [Solirubrobacteraceae bacterium]
MADLVSRIEALDTVVFAAIHSQTTQADRRSLLALHAAVARANGGFSYLEIGSHLGGSLQAVIQDHRCRQITSIDLRPQELADARLGTARYEGNSTARMLELLSRLPEPDLGKLTTIDASTSELDPDAVRSAPDWCFVDAEHTDEAVLRDARFCRRVLGSAGVIAFHDCKTTPAAIRDFLREAEHDFTYAVALPGSVFAVEFGDRAILRSPAVARAGGGWWHSLLWRLANLRPGSSRLVSAGWLVQRGLDVVALRLSRRRRSDRTLAA